MSVYMQSKQRHAEEREQLKGIPVKQLTDKSAILFRDENFTLRLEILHNV